MPRRTSAGRPRHARGGTAHARSVLLLVAGSVLVGLSTFPAPAAAQTELDREFLALINSAREEIRLPPLRFHGAAQRSAERWTPRMIADGQPSHQRLTALLMGPITKVGENVGVHMAGVGEIFEGFMESDYHRANILDPSFTHVGIATTEGPYQGADALWTTHVFVRVVRD